MSSNKEVMFSHCCPAILHFMDLLANLSHLEITLLLACSFSGSLMTASLGVGGGAFLITVMAGIVPPFALIPLHGIVQMGSNAGRAWMTRQHATRHVIGYFAAGSLLAATLALFVLGSIDPDWIPVCVALFILWVTWLPMPNIGLGKRPLGLFSGGLITTLLTMVVGASGPLVSAWLGRDSDSRWHYIANFSSCMTLQHLLKIITYGLAGFLFLPWLPLLALMIGVGYMGTLVGLKVLGKLPDKHFKLIFKIVMTVLACRVIWVTIQS